MMRTAVFMLAVVLLCAASAIGQATAGFVPPLKAIIPQVGDGGGWTTQINITATRTVVAGTLTYFDSRGEPLILDVSVSDLGDLRTNSVPFELSHGATLVVTTAGTSEPFVDGMPASNINPKARLQSTDCFNSQRREVCRPRQGFLQRTFPAPIFSPSN